MKLHAHALLRNPARIQLEPSFPPFPSFPTGDVVLSEDVPHELLKSVVVLWVDSAPARHKSGVHPG